MEDVLLPVGSALIDLNIEDLLLLADFLALACLALILFADNLTLTSAIVTRASAL